MVAEGVPRFFVDFEAAIALVGPYEHVKRAVAHHVLGATTMPTVIQHMMTYTDTRVPLMVAIRSGRGKGEVERSIRLYADGPMMSGGIDRAEVLSYIKPTYRNEQELLGYTETIKPPKAKKVKVSKKVVPIAAAVPSSPTALAGPPAPVVVSHEGYLNYDLLMLNEFAGELVDPTAKAFRDWVNIALDPYGRNEIYKKLLREAPLRYMPKVSPCVMVQPQQIPMELLYSGWVRRYLWAVGPDFTHEQLAEVMRLALRLGRVPTSTFVYDTAFKIRRAVKASDGFRFNYSGILTQLRQAWSSLYEMAIINSPRNPELAEATVFNQRDWLYKLSANYAVTKSAEFDHLAPTINVDEENIQMAYDDLLDIMPPMYRYLDEHLGWLPLNNVSQLGRIIMAVISKWGSSPSDQVVLYVHMLMPNKFTNEQIEIELQVLNLQGWVKERGDKRIEIQSR